MSTAQRLVNREDVEPIVHRNGLTLNEQLRLFDAGFKAPPSETAVGPWALVALSLAVLPWAVIGFMIWMLA